MSRSIVAGPPWAVLPVRWRGLVYTASAAMLLSSAGLFIKALTLDAFQICFVRSLVAAATIALVMGLRRQPMALRLDALSAGCLVSYSGVLILFVLATKLTTSANAVFLQYTAPIFLLFLEPWSFKRPFPRQDLWAVAGCMGGLVLFFTGHLALGGALGNVLALASGFCLAVFSLLLKWKRLRRDDNPFAVVLFGNLLVALICLPLVLGTLHVTPGQALVGVALVQRADAHAQAKRRLPLRRGVVLDHIAQAVGQGSEAHGRVGRQVGVGLRPDVRRRGRRCLRCVAKKGQAECRRRCLVLRRGLGLGSVVRGARRQQDAAPGQKCAPICKDH